ncbi:MAG TPA: hypothetical protein VME70_14095 [Mycobacteriales bacterium]|nr:hypothetical protein [Mycobacteriales bacterium]
MTDREACNAEPFHRATDRRRIWSKATPPAVASLLLVLFAALIAGAFGGGSVVRIGDDLGTIAAAAIAAVMCQEARRSHVGRDRLAWTLLTLAALAWTSGETLWAAYDLARPATGPAVSLADIGYLSAIPLVAAALIVHSGQSGDRRTRSQAVLNAVILATALLFLSWNLLLHPLWVTDRPATLTGLVTIAYPFGDVLIVFLAIRALRWLSGRERRSLAWLLFGLAAISLSDSGYTYLSVVHSYRTGSGLDIGWVAGYLGLALAGWYGRRSPGVLARRLSSPPSAAAALAPFLPLLVALGVLTARAQGGGPIDRTSLLLAFALTGSVVIRQAFVVVARVLDVGGHSPHPGGAL